MGAGQTSRYSLLSVDSRLYVYIWLPNEIKLQNRSIKVVDILYDLLFTKYSDKPIGINNIAIRKYKVSEIAKHAHVHIINMFASC